MFRYWFVCACLAGSTVVATAADGELRQNPLAKAFGSQPDLIRADLSPDGSRVSFIQMHPEGMTIARVIDLEQRGASLVLAGKLNEFDVAWCDWANNERLLCGLRYVEPTPSGIYVPVTRLVGVNADGQQMKTLLSQQLEGSISQYQDRVIDWLVDDADHVLVEMQGDQASTLGELDIHTGIAISRSGIKEDVYGWISDGYGEPRLYQEISPGDRRWFSRNIDPSYWEILHETKLTDTDDSFSPAGFGEDRQELLYFDQHEGRRALFGMRLDKDRKTRLVYAHDKVDVAGLETIGKRGRLVAVRYVDDRWRRHYFDQRIAEIHDRLERQFPNQNVSILEEDWAQRYYLVFVGSDADPGTYYRYDAERNGILKIAPANSKLKGITLAPMREVDYPTRDNVRVPAFLTLPTAGEAKNLPAIILPHGGPSARDDWSYDFLAQFLAARGYAVLQGNYRGSAGYGRAWEGAGGFRNWRVAINDVADGTRYLIDQGIADPNRICIVGWSFGGYAALMNSIEQGSLYQCVVSIAGVTDPEALGDTMRRNFVGGKAAETFIGDDDEVLKHGSPLVRAAEIKLPLLLIHARKDNNVPYRQSSSLAAAVRSRHGQIEFITYEHAEHDIRPERYRIDLLTRLGEFLDQHTAAP